MTDEWTRAEEAADTVRRAWPTTSRIALILGSGLGPLADRIESGVVLEYGAIPHFSGSTVAGHRGRLVCGLLERVPIVVMQGRPHLYEGNTAAQIALPMRTLRCLGVETLIVTNAAGGLNPSFRRSDVMLIEDHINLMFANPLMGANDDRWGPRFPDMSSPYDPGLIQTARARARQRGLTLREGVYAGVRGPTYETRAEYRMLRWLGADVVGMSTVPEVIAAVHCGLRVAGLSIVTNVALPDALPTTTHEEVVDAAAAAAPNVAMLIEDLIGTEA